MNRWSTGKDLSTLFASYVARSLCLVDLQPFSFALATPDTLHPIPVLTKLWLTRLITAVIAVDLAIPRQ